MRFAIRAIGVFLVLIGVWFGMALFFAGSAVLREEGLPSLITFIVYCVGGFYSGIQLLRCRRRGRVAASFLFIWALVFTTYFAFFHSNAGHTSLPSVIAMLLVVAGLLAVMQSSGARRVCDQTV